MSNLSQIIMYQEKIIHESFQIRWMKYYKNFGWIKLEQNYCKTKNHKLIPRLDINAKLKKPEEIDSITIRKTMFTDKVIFIKQAGVIFGTKRPLAIGGGVRWPPTYEDTSSHVDFLRCRLRRYIFIGRGLRRPLWKIVQYPRRMN